MQNTEQIISFIVQALMGFAVFFGGMWVRDLSQAVKELRQEDQRQAERLAMVDKSIGDRMSGYVPKDEFREFRAEQRELFAQLFEKMDGVRETLAKKADR